MSSISINLKTVLGKYWRQFIADFIYKPIAELAAQGEIEPETLRNIRLYLQKNGSNAIPIHF